MPVCTAAEGAPARPAATGGQRVLVCSDLPQQEECTAQCEPLTAAPSCDELSLFSPFLQPTPYPCSERPGREAHANSWRRTDSTQRNPTNQSLPWPDQVPSPTFPVPQLSEIKTKATNKSKSSNEPMSLGYEAK